MNFVQMITGIHVNRSYSIHARRSEWEPGEWIAPDWASERDAADLVDNIGKCYLPTLRDYLAEDWEIDYPKTKGLTLIEAVKLAVDHGKIKRASWCHTSRWKPFELGSRDSITWENAIATDWEVVF